MATRAASFPIVSEIKFAQIFNFNPGLLTFVS